jgi:hypothetical protein
MKAKRLFQSFLLLFPPFLLTGCIGYNSTLFVTKSNFGLDADLKPPTLEVSLARREAVIEPVFENGKTPPVEASFRVEPGAHVPFFPSISSTFSGGDAAVMISKLYGDEDDLIGPIPDSSIPMSRKPVHKLFGLFPLKPQEPGEIQPFLFGTDTTVGLKAAWSGVAATFPDTVRIGVNRKEFALAPVVLTETNAATNQTNYGVKMPSFLATMDHSINTATIADTKVKHLQYFATGEAAENLTRRKAVRDAMVARLDPVASALEKNLNDVRAVNLDSQQQARSLIEKIPDADQPHLTEAVTAAQETGLIPAESKTKLLGMVPNQPGDVKAYLVKIAKAGTEKRGQQLKEFIKRISH